MKIAILSDIHGNPESLQKVLKDIEEHKCSRIVCLGDIVGYGYDPNTCIDICRERKIDCVLGNLDAALIGKMRLDWFNPFAKNAIERQRPHVTDANKEWLQSLPYNKVENFGNKMTCAFSHGTFQYPEEFNYIQDWLDAGLEATALNKNNIKNLFVGHTHNAKVFHINTTKTEWPRIFHIDLEDEQDINLSEEGNFIVNVGSCGYPRIQPYTIYGIFDTDTSVFHHRILPFDFDSYIENMAKAGASIPLWLEHRKEEARAKPILYR